MADRIGIIVDLVGAKEAYNSIQQLTAAVQNLNKMSANINVNLNGRGAGGNNNNNLNNTHQQFQQLQQDSVDLTATVRSLGDAFVGLGRVSGSFASFAQSIGNSFTQINRAFKTDIGTTILRSLTYRATNGVLGNTQKTISRYDILNTFSQYMQLAGVNSQTASSALSRVNESILGLPIGLDEAAQRLRRYQMFMGDTNAATDLTIGVQNAIMAGGATSAAKTQTYNLIERLIATGGLTNIRQWQALLVGLGVSQRYIAEELGADPKNLLQDLSSKAISTDQFLAALQRLGSGATDAAIQLNSALGIYKNTLEAWLSNIQFAFTRGNANVISAVNESLKYSTGMGITDYMGEVRGGINSLYASGVEFIRENPGLLRDVVGNVKDLINSFSGFSGGTFVTEVVGNLGALMEVIGNGLSRIPPGELEKFTAFAATLAGPLGKVFTTVGSGAPVAMGVYNRFRDYDWNAQMQDIIDESTKMSDLVSGVLGLVNDSTMQNIISYGLVWGKPIQGFFTAIGNGLKEIAGAMVLLRAAGITSLSQLGQTLGITAASWGPALGMSAMGITAALGIGQYRRQQNRLNTAATANMQNANYVNEINADIAYLEGLRGLPGGGDVNTVGRMGYTLDELYMLRQKAQNRYITTSDATNNQSITGDVVAAAHREEEALGEVASAYALVSEAAAESARTQISLFEEVSLSAQHSWSEMYSNLQQQSDVYGRMQRATQILTQEAFAHPEESGFITTLLEGGVENLETIEMIANRIAQGEDFMIIAEQFNLTEQAIANATKQLEYFNMLFGGGDYADATYTKGDAASIIAGAFGLDEVDVAAQLEEIWGDAEEVTQEGLRELAATIRVGGKKAANEAQKATAEIARAMSQLDVNPDAAVSAIAEWGWAVQQGIISAKRLAVAAANDAVSAINAALGNVRATPGSASVDRWTGRTSGFTQTPYANGGIIYAANGMLLDFGAIGTDTVPAMLTPGEFVVRRAAVNRVGIPFLQRLNSLDMAGAFDRAIKTGVFSGGGMVRNYYRDNHAQVTMNNYRASQDYSSRRMGRYVRSL